MDDNPVKLVRKGQKIEVESRDTGDVLAWCFIGDEYHTEKIADLLSAKGLRTAAQEFREMVAADRKQASRTPAPKPSLLGQLGEIFR